MEKEKLVYALQLTLDDRDHLDSALGKLNAFVNTVDLAFDSDFESNPADIKWVFSCIREELEVVTEAIRSLKRWTPTRANRRKRKRQRDRITENQGLRSHRKSGPLAAWP